MNKSLLLHSHGIWWAGTHAVMPQALMARWFSKSQPISTPVNVLAVGKAACAMANAFIPHAQVRKGLVITKHDHQQPVAGCQVMTADHPVTGQASVKAAEAVFKWIETIDADLPVYLLLSGGASALLGDIPAGVSLADWQWLNHRLLGNGFDITAINTCRRALGTLKGGKLLNLLAPRPVITLALSDVVGDNPALIGSGPTVISPPNTRPTDQRDVLIRSLFTGGQYPQLEALLRAGLDQITPDLGNGRFVLLGSAEQAVKQAEDQARQWGYHTTVIQPPMTSDVTVEAKQLMQLLIQPVDKPTCYLLWGEPTVILPDNGGLGGRNQQLALLVAQQMPTDTQWLVLCGGTDGTDGPTDAAGAWVDNLTQAKCLKLGVNLELAINQANGYPALKQLNQLWVTGPTQTNVMDLVVALKLP